MPGSPFHLAFFVEGIASTRRSYGETLGGTEGRRSTRHTRSPRFGTLLPRADGDALELKSVKHPEHVFTA